jgi:hypothetical protein
MAKAMALRLTVAVAALVAVSCGETRVSHYATMAEARRAGAIERGWVPPFLPETTTSIRESHNIDTNETWGTFRFSDADSTALKRALVEIDPTGQHVRRPSGLPDWPRELEGQLAREALRRSGLETFKASSEDVFVALDRKAGSGFFWRGAS